MIIMEYCALGDLEEYLKKHKANFRNEFLSSAYQTMSSSGSSGGSSSGYVAVDVLQTHTDETAAPRYEFVFRLIKRIYNYSRLKLLL